MCHCCVFITVDAGSTVLLAATKSSPSPVATTTSPPSPLPPVDNPDEPAEIQPETTVSETDSGSRGKEEEEIDGR